MKIDGGMGLAQSAAARSAADRLKQKSGILNITAIGTGKTR